MSEQNTVGPVIGSDVLAVRTVLELTQADLADAVGVSKKTAYNWEARGDQPLPPAGARKFATWARREITAERGGIDLPLSVTDRLRAAAGFEMPPTSPPAGDKAPAPRPEDDDFTETELRYAEAHHRAMHRDRDKTPRELAASQLRLAQRATQAYDFVEAAIDLGVHPALTRELATLIADVTVDAGIIMPLSAVKGPEEAARQLVGRAARLQKKAGPVDKADWTPLRLFEVVEAMESDPDYSNLTQDGHGLAAYEGDEQIAHDADPED